MSHITTMKDNIEHDTCMLCSISHNSCPEMVIWQISSDTLPCKYKGCQVSEMSMSRRVILKILCVYILLRIRSIVLDHVEFTIRDKIIWVDQSE